MAMSDPWNFVGAKMSAGTSLAAGASIAALIMQGQPWHVRLMAALCGTAAAVVFTPILSPVSVHLVGTVYYWLQVPPADVPREAIVNGTAFLLGLTGIDICRWMIERTKFGLSILRFPRPKPPPD